MKKTIQLFFGGLLLALFLSPALSQAQTPVFHICDGEEVCLVAGAPRGAIQWQSSFDTLNWADVFGEVNDTFCFVPTVDEFFRVVISEGTCDPIYSNVMGLELYSIGVNAGQDTSGCLGSSFMASAAASGGFGSYSYTWELGGSPAGTGANPMLSLPGASNSFVVTATDSLGCEATDTVEISGYSILADAGPDTTGCNGSMITVGGSPTAAGGIAPYTYNWTQAGSSVATAANPLVNVGPGPLVYVLSVTDAGGCMAMDSVLVDTGGNASSGTVTFSYTGAQQTFVVPPCVSSLNLDVYGAQGGANWISNDNFGGRTQGTLAVTPGETLYVYVGQQPNGITGGWNGGGNGESAGQGGGGGSDIRRNGTTLNDRIIVGGGGGGAGYWSSTHVIGGQGGGLVGGDGSRAGGNPGGLGGTQSGPGASGTCVSLNNVVCAGSFGQGGAPSSCGCEGYGGGGGWYGGAGSGNCRGGGGGSGYAAPSLTGVTHTQGVRTGNGQIIISW